MTTAYPDIQGFSLHITVTVQPSDVPTFFEHFAPIYEASIQEPECLYLEVFQDPDDKGKISWIENWSKSPKWFEEVGRSLFAQLNLSVDVDDLMS